MNRTSRLATVGCALASLTLSAGTSYAASGVLPIHSDRPSVIDSGVVKRTTPLDPSTRIGVTITLPLTDPAGLDKFVAEVTNPASPIYGHYLTPAQFASKFGTCQVSYDAVMSWVKSSGLTVTESSDSRDVIAVNATAAQLQKALNVQYYNYVRSDNTTFFSTTSAPKLPAAIAGYVKSIYGMSSFAPGEPQYQIATPEMRAKMTEAQAASRLGSHSPSSTGSSVLDSVLVAPPTNDTGGTGHGGNFSPSDLNSAYLMPNLGSNGAGQTLGCFEIGGFHKLDPINYEKYYGLPHTPVDARLVAGYNGDIFAGESVEAALDIEMELALSPNAKKILVYETGTEPTFAGTIIDGLTAVADDDTISALDISYGLDELQQSEESGPRVFDDENTVFKRAAAEGISVFTSAGDQGAYGRLVLGGAIPPSDNAEDPASQPFVTSVGGTTMFLFGGQDYLETVWNELGADYGATGGGVSSVWKIPSYQLLDGGTSIASVNGGSATMRNVPDVAAVADPYTPVDVYSTAYGGWVGIGGTSASAPIWAGFAGVINQARAEAGEPAIGFANPLLYGLGESTIPFQFHDVYDGTNGNPNLFGGVGGYFAGVGYDNTTGFGSIYGAILLSNLVAEPTSVVNSVGNPPFVPKNFRQNGVKNTAISVAWSPADHATGYVVSFVIDDEGTTYTAFAAASQTQHVVVKNLAPNTTYVLTLAAVNQYGSTYSPTQLTITTGSATP